MAYYKNYVFILKRKNLYCGRGFGGGQSRIRKNTTSPQYIGVTDHIAI